MTGMRVREPWDPLGRYFVSDLVDDLFKEDVTMAETWVVNVKTEEGERVYGVRAEGEGPERKLYVFRSPGFTDEEIVEAVFWVVQNHDFTDKECREITTVMSLDATHRVGASP